MVYSKSLLPIYFLYSSSVQFSHSPCLTLSDTMDYSTSGFPVHHKFLELAQTHVHRVSDAFQASHSLVLFSCLQSFPASGSFPMSQLFTSRGQSTGASASPSVFSNEYSGLISFRIDWFDILALQGTLRSPLQHHSSKASIFRAQLSLGSNSHIHTWQVEKP